MSVVDRTPPHDFDAEQAILGSIMMIDGSYRTLSETLRVEHFADPLHGRIFEAAGAMVDRGDKVTPLTLRPYLGQDQAFGDVGGAVYLARLCASRAPIEHVETLADQVRDLFVRRKAIDAIEAALTEDYKPSAATTAVEQIETAERDLAQIASLGRKDADERWFREWVADVVAQAEAAYQRGAGLAGLSTDFRALDEILGGLRPSDLVILAGRPAMGKSAMASNIAMNAAEKYREEIVDGQVAVADGAMVGFWSLEMSGQQLVQRVIAERSRISSSALPSGKVNSADFDRFITVAHGSRRRSSVPSCPRTALSPSGLRPSG